MNRGILLLSIFAFTIPTQAQVPDNYAENERKTFNVRPHGEIDFLLLGQTDHVGLWIEEDNFDLYPIHEEYLDRLVGFMFDSTAVDSERGAAQYIPELLQSVFARENTGFGQRTGPRRVEMILYDDPGSIASGFKETLVPLGYLGSGGISTEQQYRWVAWSAAYSITSNIAVVYGRNGDPNDLWPLALSSWVANEVHGSGKSGDLNWNFPLFAPGYPEGIEYGGVAFFIEYLVHLIGGSDHLYRLVQTCARGGQCDPEDPDDGDWLELRTMDDFEYALRKAYGLDLGDFLIGFYTAWHSGGMDGSKYRIIKYTDDDQRLGIESSYTMSVYPGGSSFVVFEHIHGNSFSLKVDAPEGIEHRLLAVYPDRTTKKLHEIESGEVYYFDGEYLYATLFSINRTWFHADPAPVKIYSGTSIPVSNEREQDELPESVSLSHNYPNPFNPSTSVTYKLDRSGPVEIAVYDLTGRIVETLVDAVQPAGSHEVRFDADGLPTGTYLYRLRAGTETLTRTMTLVR